MTDYKNPSESVDYTLKNGAISKRRIRDGAVWLDNTKGFAGDPGWYYSGNQKAPESLTEGGDAIVPTKLKNGLETVLRADGARWLDEAKGFDGSPGWYYSGNVRAPEYQGKQSAQPTQQLPQIIDDTLRMVPSHGQIPKLTDKRIAELSGVEPQAPLGRRLARAEREASEQIGLVIPRFGGAIGRGFTGLAAATSGYVGEKLLPKGGVSEVMSKGEGATFGERLGMEAELAKRSWLDTYKKFAEIETSPELQPESTAGEAARFGASMIKGAGEAALGGVPLMAGIAAGESAGQALEQGATPTKALKYGVSRGALTGALLKTLGQFGRKPVTVGQAIRDAVGKGVFGGAASAVSGNIAEVAILKDRTSKEILESLKSDLKLDPDTPLTKGMVDEIAGFLAFEGVGALPRIAQIRAAHRRGGTSQYPLQPEFVERIPSETPIQAESVSPVTVEGRIAGGAPLPKGRIAGGAPLPIGTTAKRFRPSLVDATPKRPTLSGARAMPTEHPLYTREETNLIAARKSFEEAQFRAAKARVDAAKGPHVEHLQERAKKAAREAIEASGRLDEARNAAANVQARMQAETGLDLSGRLRGEKGYAAEEGQVEIGDRGQYQGDGGFGPSGEAGGGGIVTTGGGQEAPQRREILTRIKTNPEARAALESRYKEIIGEDMPSHGRESEILDAIHENSYFDLLLDRGDVMLHTPRRAGETDAAWAARQSSEYFQRIGNNDKVVDAYERMPETKGGKIVSPDLQLKLLSAVQKNPIQGYRYAIPSQDALMDNIIRSMRNAPPQSEVYILGGGSATGKSTLADRLADDPEIGTVIDANMKANGILESAMVARQAGHIPVIAFPAPPPFDVVVDRAIDRAIKQGRVTPISTLVHSYINGFKTFENVFVRVGDMFPLEVIGQDGKAYGQAKAAGMFMKEDPRIKGALSEESAIDQLNEIASQVLAERLRKDQTITPELANALREESTRHPGFEKPKQKRLIRGDGRIEERPGVRPGDFGSEYTLPGFPDRTTQAQPGLPPADFTTGPTFPQLMEREYARQRGEVEPGGGGGAPKAGIGGAPQVPGEVPGGPKAEVRPSTQEKTVPLKPKVRINLEPPPKRDKTPKGSKEWMRHKERGAVAVPDLGKAVEGIKNVLKDVFGTAKEQAAAWERSLLAEKGGRDPVANFVRALEKEGIITKPYRAGSLVVPEVSKSPVEYTFPGKVLRDATPGEIETAFPKDIRLSGMLNLKNWRDQHNIAQNIFGFDNPITDVMLASAERLQMNRQFIPPFLDAANKAKVRPLSMELREKLKVPFGKFLDLNQKFRGLRTLYDEVDRNVSKAESVVNGRRERHTEAEMTGNPSETAKTAKSLDRAEKNLRKAEQEKFKFEHEHKAELDEYFSELRRITGERDKILRKAAPSDAKAIQIFRAAEDRATSENMTPAEKDLVRVIKEINQKIGRELAERGIPIREQGAFMTHSFKDLVPKDFNRKYGKEAEPELRSILAFAHRQGDTAWVPDPWLMESYIKTASWRIANQPVVTKWQPMIDDSPHAFNTYASYGDRTAPGAAKYIQGILEQVQDFGGSKTWADEAFKVAREAEYHRVLFGSLRTMFKHIPKAINNLALGGIKTPINVFNVGKSAVGQLLPQAEPIRAWVTKKFPEFSRNAEAQAKLNVYLNSMVGITEALGGDPTVAAIRDAFLVRKGILKPSGQEQLNLAKRLGGVLGHTVKVVEHIENAMNVSDAALRAQHKGMGPNQSLRAIIYQLMDLSHRGGPNDPGFFKSPGNVLFWFQREPVKIADYYSKLLAKSAKGEKDEFGSYYSARLAYTLLAMGLVYGMGKKAKDYSQTLDTDSAIKEGLETVGEYGMSLPVKAVHLPFRGSEIAGRGLDLVKVWADPHPKTDAERVAVRLLMEEVGEAAKTTTPAETAIETGKMLTKKPRKGDWVEWAAVTAPGIGQHVRDVPRRYDFKRGRYYLDLPSKESLRREQYQAEMRARREIHGRGTGRR